MNKMFFCILAVFVLINGGCISTGYNNRLFTPRSEKRRIERAIERIINTTDPNVNVGIKIASTQVQQTIFEKNSSRNFVPASTIKLITLAAALHYLGPSFRFNTELYTDGFTKNKKAIQNLYIRGSGDPSLMDHHLMLLASELRQMGIKKIYGNIYIDDQIFDDVSWPKGAMWDDRGQGFGAPVSGLNLNYNRLEIKVLPGHKPKRQAQVVIRPNTDLFLVQSNLITMAQDSSSVVNLEVLNNKNKITHDGLHKGDQIRLEGQVAASSGPQYKLLAVNDPSLLAGNFLRHQLSRAGIKFDGTIEQKAVRLDSLFLTKHQSRSLSEALIDFTKVSNNVANDALIKTIAVEAGYIPASFDMGLKLIKEFLSTHVGINSRSLVAADGSGLSRYNLITPDQLVKLLTYAANHFHMGPEFLTALPIAGQDGTLSARFNKPEVIGSIRAKTGSMSGIASLAGFLNGNDQRRYAFAIMINGFVGSPSKYLRMQDQILSAILGESEVRLAKVK